MTMNEIPMWVQWIIAALLVLGALLTLIGSIGLVRLANFYQRIHGPTMGTTLGTGCVLIASMLFFSVLQGRLVVHELLITCFIVMTMPVTAMLLMRAALYRDYRMNRADADAPTGLTDVPDTDQEATSR
jgi:multicomponent K+:H+ antiporter subunit G